MLSFGKLMKKNWRRRSHSNLTQKTKQTLRQKGHLIKSEAAAIRNGYLESQVSAKLICNICTLTMETVSG